MDAVWFCRVLLLFSFVSNHDQGCQRDYCAFVSVLEEYTGRRRPSWLEQADSKMIYECKNNQQVLYVVRTRTYHFNPVQASRGPRGGQWHNSAQHPR